MEKDLDEKEMKLWLIDKEMLAGKGFQVANGNSYRLNAIQFNADNTFSSSWNGASGDWYLEKDEQDNWKLVQNWNGIGKYKGFTANWIFRKVMGAAEGDHFEFTFDEDA